MSIKERIENLGVYFHSMNVAAENNIIYIRVKFPSGWVCSEVTEYNFNVKAVKDEIPGYFYFYSNMDIGFDSIFDAIEYNIKFNEEAQEKISLLKVKIEELKNIFENEHISVLKTLEFKYKKRKNTQNKTKKQNSEEEINTSEEILTNVDYNETSIDNNEYNVGVE